ncbi:MAG: hypothetical protein R3C56_07395 [Pirellulaceae bacterium]
MESRDERWTPSFGASQLHRVVGPAGRVELVDAEAIRYVAGESLRSVVSGVSQEQQGGGERLAYGRLARSCVGLG